MIGDFDSVKGSPTGTHAELHKNSWCLIDYSDRTDGCCGEREGETCGRLRLVTRSARFIRSRCSHHWPCLSETSIMSLTAVPRHAIRAARLVRSARFFSSSLPVRYDNVLVSRPKPGVTLVTLNRPKALNALNAAHFRDIASALKEADDDANVGAMVLTGSDKAFAGMRCIPVNC